MIGLSKRLLFLLSVTIREYLTFFAVRRIGSGNKLQYTNGKNLYMLRTDMLIKWNPSFKAIAEEFIFDEESFKTEFVNAWAKLMNSDMF